MDSIQYMGLLFTHLSTKGIASLNPDQTAEVEQIIRRAMEDAWEVGNGFDHGVGFDMSWMTTGEKEC